MGNSLAVFERVWEWMETKIPLETRSTAVKRRSAEFDEALDQFTEPRTHLDRVNAAAILARLARKDPRRYHVRTMKAFTTILAVPARYGRGQPLEGNPDPESQDTVTMMETVCNRTPLQKKTEEAEGYIFRLPAISPFEYRENRFYLGDIQIFPYV